MKLLIAKVKLYNTEARNMLHTNWKFDSLNPQKSLICHGLKSNSFSPNG